MSRLRSQLAPIAAGGLVIAVAVAVLVLLGTARDHGVAALEKAKLAQVQATANSFNARVVSSLGSVAGLGARGWELTPGSASDQARLQEFAVDPEAVSGFFLIDGSDRVTAGILLQPDRLGSTFDVPGWTAAKPLLTQAPAVVLPATDRGFTTELASYAFVVAIRDAKGAVRGAFVFEQAITPDSSFVKEIAQLADPDAASDAWFFIDSNGSVIATTEQRGLGQPVEDHRYSTVRPGLSRVDGRLVVAADVPSVGWRVIFRQNRSEFVADLAGPLQTAGVVLVLLLLSIGLMSVALLVRRLRQAQEEERRLRELTESQDEFISIVSHELRTPVAGVLGFLQTSLDHWATMSDDDRLHAVRRAVSNARRLQAMTRDVLDTEGIESGRFGYSRHHIDLVDELRAAVDAAEGVDAAHQIELVLDVPLVMVDADPDRIQQVLANLLENARKSAPPTDPISIGLAVVDGRAQVSVTDRGAGIEPDSLDRIFDKFVRGRDGNVSGTGLGLYIVRRIVEAHDGRIWVTSVPGDHTSFTFELPVLVGAPSPDTPASPVA